MKDLNLNNEPTRQPLQAPSLFARLKKTAAVQKTQQALVAVGDAVADAHRTDVSGTAHTTRLRVGRASSETVGAVIGATKLAVGAVLGAAAGVLTGGASGLTADGVAKLRAATSKDLVFLGQWEHQEEKGGSSFIHTKLVKMPDGTKPTDDHVVIPSDSAAGVTFLLPSGDEVDGLAIVMDRGARILLFANNDDQGVYVCSLK